TPVRVQSSLSFVAVSAGAEATCALAADHRAWCWGLSSVGGTGAPVGGPLFNTTPVAVLGDRTYSEIETGATHACARAADGTWCWGNTGRGQLGSGQDNGVVKAVPPRKVVFPN
ncbi:MAG: hypothetical protein R2882_15200, partial [Gemmatimonadales bacterium]